MFLIIGIRYFFTSTSPQRTRQSSFLFPAEGGPLPTVAQKTSPEDKVTANPSEFKLLQLTKEPIIGATLSKDELGLIFYRRAGGNVIRIDLNGENEETLSRLTVVGITDILWAPEKDRAIVSYLENDDLKRFLHVIATSSTAFLPKGVTSVMWSSDGKLLTYTRPNRGQLDIIIAGPNGENPKTLASDPIPDWNIIRADSAGLVLMTTPSYLADGLSMTLSLNKKEANFISLQGLALLAAPIKGAFVVTSTTNDGLLEPLKFIDNKGVTTAGSNIKTLLEKCAWAKDASALYCAVPESTGGHLPDDWYQGEVSFQDRIVKIDSLTGAVSELLPPSSFDATNLFTDSKQKFLFFTNKKDATLWRLELGNR